jgi:hypothetical protein
MDRVMDVGRYTGLCTEVIAIRPSDMDDHKDRGFDFITCGTEDVIFRRGLGDWMEKW